MKHEHYDVKAEAYLNELCGVKPNRRTGSTGNREATGFFARTISLFGYGVDDAPFEAMDHISRGAMLSHGEETFEVHVSPYSLGCDVLAEVVTVSTVEELEQADCSGKILLMKGEICAEQLMPKNFVFYNPESHKRIIAILERSRPAAIITSTERNTEQVGALYPFPLIVDGDFDIPSVYCRDEVGEAISSLSGSPFQLRIDASRIESSASNVIARLEGGASGKIVITAHIDAYEDAIGAADNASGIVVLLLLAEMLSGYRGDRTIEIAAFNGEDHYSAGGQMDYIERYGSEMDDIVLAINIDDVGYKYGRSSYSLYGCGPQLEWRIDDMLHRFDGMVRGPQWFNGDHMVFVQKGIPSVAVTSEYMAELLSSVTHTSADTPEIVDCGKLVQVAEALEHLVRSI